MTTVTGMTADRMLAIEAASVIDGDVDASGNLILTKHDGSQINAGSVIGPPGPQGPVGQDLIVCNAQPVLDIGIINQIRAGRQLSPADFGNMGLNPPLGLWNLSDLTDSSGNGRNLSNKGAIPFASGINGVAASAAQFSGSSLQALYISDTGANDPFRFKTGSMGGWFRTPNSAVQQILAKVGSNGSWANTVFQLQLSNGLLVWNCGNGSGGPAVSSTTNVCDDQWHFGVATFDGATIRLYVDGMLENGTQWQGIINQSAAVPFNIGSYGGDGSTASTGIMYGRIDEVFITADVLSDDQVRLLYCAKIAHTLGANPKRASINVHRRRRGGAFALADFATQPLRMHNFSAGSLGDEGSNSSSGTAKTLTNNSPTLVLPTNGPGGLANNAMIFSGAHAGLSAHDGLGLPIAEQLPSGLNPRSYGCWFKTTGFPAASMVLVMWGTLSTGDNRLIISSSTGSGGLISTTGANEIDGTHVADGQWHFAVVVQDNNEPAGNKHKLYCDCRIMGTSGLLNTLTLAGANMFRVGVHNNGSNPFVGMIDGVFVCNYALTIEQIKALYAKGMQDLGISPKNPGDNIERMDANSLLVAFDDLETTSLVDLAVA